MRKRDIPKVVAREGLRQLSFDEAISILRDGDKVYCILDYETCKPGQAPAWGQNTHPVYRSGWVIVIRESSGNLLVLFRVEPEGPTSPRDSIARIIRCYYDRGEYAKSHMNVNGCRLYIKDGVPLGSDYGL